MWMHETSTVDSVVSTLRSWSPPPCNCRRHSGRAAGRNHLCHLLEANMWIVSSVNLGAFRSRSVDSGCRSN